MKTPHTRPLPIVQTSRRPAPPRRLRVAGSTAIGYTVRAGVTERGRGDGGGRGGGEARWPELREVVYRSTSVKRGPDPCGRRCARGRGLTLEQAAHLRQSLQRDGGRAGALGSSRRDDEAPTRRATARAPGASRTVRRRGGEAVASVASPRCPRRAEVPQAEDDAADRCRHCRGGGAPVATTTAPRAHAPPPGLRRRRGQRSASARGGARAVARGTARVASFRRASRARGRDAAASAAAVASDPPADAMRGREIEAKGGGDDDALTVERFGPRWWAAAAPTRCTDDAWRPSDRHAGGGKGGGGKRRDGVEPVDSREFARHRSTAVHDAANPRAEPDRRRLDRGNGHRSKHAGATVVVSVGAG